MPATVITAIADHLDLEAQIGGYEAPSASSDEIERAYADIATLMNAAPRWILDNSATRFIDTNQNWLKSVSIQRGEDVARRKN